MRKEGVCINTIEMAVTASPGSLASPGLSGVDAEAKGTEAAQLTSCTITIGTGVGRVTASAGASVIAT